VAEVTVDKDFQKEYWDNNPNARRYDHPVVEAFTKQRLDYLKTKIDFGSLTSAFDVGCGDGFATYYFDKEIPNVEAGDASQLLLDINPIPKERKRLIDAEKMEIADNTYDLVYAWEVMHHLNNPKKAVQEMARISKKYVVLFEPNRDHLLQFAFGLAVKHERGILRSTKDYLISLAEGTNTRVAACDYCGKIPPNKTPTSWLPTMLSMPFLGSKYTGISIALILEKK